MCQGHGSGDGVGEHASPAHVRPVSGEAGAVGWSGTGQVCGVRTGRLVLSEWAQVREEREKDPLCPRPAPPRSECRAACARVARWNSVNARNARAFHARLSRTYFYLSVEFATLPGRDRHLSCWRWVMFNPAPFPISHLSLYCTPPLPSLLL